jgi:hypothetical protein
MKKVIPKVYWRKAYVLDKDISFLDFSQRVACIPLFSSRPDLDRVPFLAGDDEQEIRR